MDIKLKNRISKIIKDSSVDCILLLNTNIIDPNFHYVTGFTSGVFEGTATLIKKTGVTVFASKLEYETAEKEAIPGIGVKHSEIQNETLLKEIKGKELGINAEFLPYNYFYNIKKNYEPSKIIDVSNNFAAARIIKDDIEINKIKKAVKITKTAMLQIQKDFKEGVTELEIAGKFDYISSKLGSQGPSFETIVCFGKNSALPHHSPGLTKLKNGDIVLIDAGARYENYCSDMTRTFIYKASKGKDRDKKREIYDVVKTAQAKAIDAIKKGAVGNDIDKIARDYINNFGNGKYRGKFIHSLGHSVGIEVHDGKGFQPGSKLKLKPGMVITVEPGVYVDDFGGVRIEDDVLVTSDGAEVL
jgi:Xaa-Pro dipeptidase